MLRPLLCWTAASSCRTADPRDAWSGKSWSCPGWELDGNEETCGEKIVLARLIDDPHEPSGLGGRVLQDAVNLSRLERRTITSVPDADKETTTCPGHAYSSNRLIFMSTRPIP